jgi:hypothetical protein
MTKPDWNKRQHPEQKAKEHGKRDALHNEHEHGLGGERDPQRESLPNQDAGDLTALEPEDSEPIVGLVDTTTSASWFYIPNCPPVRDQDGTPQCVAYSNAYDQAQQDRPEGGKFYDFWESRFFNQIGGGPNGALMTAGLTQRRDYGYPTIVGGDRSGHRIASYTQVALNVTAIKSALAKGHGVLVIGDWFHSWFHPFLSGKLPAPDYRVGGHAFWIHGWNDTYGFTARNSWGTDWGLRGDFRVPYAFLSRMYAAYRTTDK